jgi:hypothetical protein
MNLNSEMRQNIQRELDFSSTPTGEARKAGGEENESLEAMHAPKSPARSTARVTSRTAVYGPVRTVVWQGSAGDCRPYADQVEKSHLHTISSGVREKKQMTAFRVHCEAVAYDPVQTIKSLPHVDRPGGHVDASCRAKSKH